MPNRRTFAGALALATPLGLTLMLAQTPALAQPSGPPPHMGPPTLHKMMRAIHELSLTEDQKTQLHALMDQYHQAAQQQHDQIVEGHKALADQVIAPSFDEAAIRTAVASLAPLMADELVGEAALLRDVRALLSSKQRDQLQQSLEAPDPEGGRGGWDGNGPHRHGNPE